MKPMTNSPGPEIPSSYGRYSSCCAIASRLLLVLAFRLLPSCSDLEPIPSPSPAITEIPPTLSPSPTVSPTPAYIDADADGFSPESGDCDDNNREIHPEAIEVCDGLDNNCDGSVDGSDSANAVTSYLDLDQDGYGDSPVITISCVVPDGYSVLAGDCDDLDPNISPMATEICDDAAVDENCNGYANDDDPAVDESSANVFYLDQDLDGYGASSAVPELYCALPPGYSANHQDCNDSDASYNPSAAESDCTDAHDFNCDGSTTYADSDQDGYAACLDCNDQNVLVHPEASEAVADNLDQNCDSYELCYADFDNDGYRPSLDATVSSPDLPCDGDGEAISNDPVGDCDDTNHNVNPESSEYCNGLDDNCDGAVDALDAVDGSTWYQDADQDGEGNPARSEYACNAPTGYVDNSNDCLDSDASVYSGAIEICDSAARDENCNGLADDEDPTTAAASKQQYYPDTDTDGFGDQEDSGQPACHAPDGYVDNNEDCDDHNPAYNPAAMESCDDPSDYNCDGASGYADSDTDGYPACNDCNDFDSSVNPAAGELTGDSLDQNCDGLELCFRDADNDGYRPDAEASTASNDKDCADPFEATSSDPVGDCNDTSASIYPSAAETCDLIDNDCDGSVDENVQALWYVDADGDLYGSSTQTIRACQAPAGYVAYAGDCNDTNAAIHPGVAEVAGDEIDQDCNLRESCYLDQDDDGYRPDAGSVYASSDTDCRDSGEALSTDPTGDCADTNAAIYPGANERCNGVDDDCDVLVDGADSDITAFLTTWYRDNDQDGFGQSSDFMQSCLASAPYTALEPGDCDDASNSVNPTGTEFCDGIDQNCNSVVDDRDIDLDSYIADECGGEDCDDSNADIYPGAEEICGDGQDNNCDQAACLLAGAYSLAQADARLLAEASANWAGRAVAPAGDSNGDGFDDILIGARYEDAGATDAGAVYLVSGPVTGTLSLGSATAKMLGENASDYVGEAIAGRGDANGDAYPDVLIGSWAHDGNGLNSGIAYLLLGPVRGTIDLSNAHARIMGEYPEDRAGTGVAFAGDLYGDGSDDLLIGAPYESSQGNQAGSVYVVNGPVSGTMTLEQASAQLMGETDLCLTGRSLSGLDDISGDGIPDLLIGAYGDGDGGVSAGAAYIVYGPVVGDYLLSTAPVKLVGENANDFAGFAVAPAGDVNGDAIPDVLVGAYGYDGTVGGSKLSDTGVAYLLFGPLAGTIDLSAADARIVGAHAGDYAGASLASAGDVNGDGYSDIVVGAWREDTVGSNAGATYLFYGPLSGELSMLDADATFFGEAAYDGSGYAVSGAGDVNHDGRSDLLIGAYAHAEPGSDAGAAYLELAPGL